MRVNLYPRKQQSGRRIWWGQWTDEREPMGSPERVKRRSTKCTDRRAAAIVAAQWERDGADPVHAAAHQATFGEASRRFVAELSGRGLSAGSINMYTCKAGHCVRLLGASTRLAFVDARAVDRFVEDRRAEGAAQHTIHKEVVALRGILAVARRRGEFLTDPRAVMPIRFRTGYQPRTRFLTRPELYRLVHALPAGRAAAVVFAVGVSARRREVFNARHEDIGPDHVHLRGTKTEGSDRDVPIVPMLAEMVEAAGAYADGTDGRLFRRWPNARRDILKACELAQIAPVTWNDLRRTFASLLVQAGAATAHVAKAMGHASTAMVDRVYGRHTKTSLGQLIAASTRGDRDEEPPGGRRATAELKQQDPRGDEENMMNNGKSETGAADATPAGGPSGTRTRDLRIKRPEENTEEAGDRAGGAIGVQGQAQGSSAERDYAAEALHRRQIDAMAAFTEAEGEKRRRADVAAIQEAYGSKGIHSSAPPAPFRVTTEDRAKADAIVAVAKGFEASERRNCVGVPFGPAAPWVPDPEAIEKEAKRLEARRGQHGEFHRWACRALMAYKHETAGLSDDDTLRKHAELIVADVMAEIGTVERERDAYLANLTATQKRCTDLLEENRVLRGEAADARHGIDDVLHENRTLRADLHAVQRTSVARGDALNTLQASGKEVEKKEEPRGDVANLVHEARRVVDALVVVHNMNEGDRMILVNAIDALAAADDEHTHAIGALVNLRRTAMHLTNALQMEEDAREEWEAFTAAVKSANRRIRGDR